MARRAGLNDAFFAFSVISGLVLLYDLTQRARISAETKAKAASTKTRLRRIEQGIEKINAKLG